MTEMTFPARGAESTHDLPGDFHDSGYCGLHVRQQGQVTPNKHIPVQTHAWSSAWSGPSEFADTHGPRHALSLGRRVLGSRGWARIRRALHGSLKGEVSLCPPHRLPLLRPVCHSPAFRSSKQTPRRLHPALHTPRAPPHPGQGRAEHQRPGPPAQRCQSPLAEPLFCTYKWGYRESQEAPRDAAVKVSPRPRARRITGPRPAGRLVLCVRGPRSILCRFCSAHRAHATEFTDGRHPQGHARVSRRPLRVPGHCFSSPETPSWSPVLRTGPSKTVITEENSAPRALCMVHKTGKIDVQHKLNPL